MTRQMVGSTWGPWQCDQQQGPHEGIKKVNLFCHNINKEEEGNVEVLCTDHQADIAAMMRDQFPEIEHRWMFDT